MGSVSFWQAEATATAPFSAAPLREDTEADAVVIGAGITGVAAALWLARAGARVVTLESRQIAAGASGRNAGFLLGGTAEPYTQEIARYGHERARRIWAFSAANHETAAALIAELGELGWDCGYRRRGSLRLAMTEAELADVRESAERLCADGWPAQLVAHADLPPAIQATYLGGSYHPSDGEVYPVRYVRGLALLAARAGARFYEESPAVGLEEDDAGVRVTTPAGSVHARQALLATNAWLPEVGALAHVSWLNSRIEPKRGQVLATAPLDHTLFECPCYADEGYQYWRQLPDGRLVIGGWRNHSFGTEDVADETPAEPVQGHLESFLRGTIGLGQLPIEHRWAGIMAFTRDGLPLVGHLPGTRHCYLAGGYTGHGNAYAVAAARIVSELMLGEPAPDADLFDLARSVPTSDGAMG